MFKRHTKRYIDLVLLIDLNLVLNCVSTLQSFGICKQVSANNKKKNILNVFLQLKDWLDLSLNAHVPPSLLLLSRTLYLPETIDPVTKLGMSISALPEAAALRWGL